MGGRKELGKKIKKARTAKGLKAQQVGAARGYTEKNGESYVSNWETGKRPVPNNKIRELARILDMSIDDFIV